MSQLAGLRLTASGLVHCQAMRLRLHERYPSPGPCSAGGGALSLRHTFQTQHQHRINQDDDNNIVIIVIIIIIIIVVIGNNDFQKRQYSIFLSNIVPEGKYQAAAGAAHCRPGDGRTRQQVSRVAAPHPTNLLGPLRFCARCL